MVFSWGRTEKERERVEGQVLSCRRAIPSMVPFKEGIALESSAMAGGRDKPPWIMVGRA